jgi:hypothetical protein
MYESGTDGVQRDDVKAYRYFDALIRGYDEDRADPQSLGAVASAVVSLAQYELTGIAGSDVRPDPERAMNMLQYAATSFKSTEAQFRLGRIYLDGTAVTSKDVVRAARWLALAANKDHRGAEATLGHMMFTGQGMSTQHARGLAWEMRGLNGAQGAKDDWIRETYARDYAAASPDDREMAKGYYSFFKPGDRIPVPAQTPNPGVNAKNIQNVLSVAPVVQSAQPVGASAPVSAQSAVSNSPTPGNVSSASAPSLSVSSTSAPSETGSSFPSGSGNPAGSAAASVSTVQTGSTSVGAATAGTSVNQGGPGGRSDSGEGATSGTGDHHWDGSSDHHWDAFRALSK